MFNYLIESNSHRNEFKRRGSFLLYTTVTYGLVLAITGIASVYAYDAQMGERNYEISWLQPVNLDTIETPTRVTPERPRNSNDHSRSGIAERALAMLSVNHPEVPPIGVSVKPNKNLPLPDHGTFSVTGRDRDPAIVGGTPSGTGNALARVPGRIVIEAGDPPPTPSPAPIKKVITASRVLNSQALSLPKPIYPPLAKQIKAQGTVAVQVLIDERGNVISAKVISGPPLLIAEAQKAALQARFSPTLIGDTPVKVSGVITYNFVMQ